MTITPKSFRIAVYCALALSVLGMIAVYLLLMGPHYTMKFAQDFSVQIMVGYGVMILVIETIGIRLRSSLAQSLGGVTFGLLLFMAGVFAGSATTMILTGDADAYSYVLKPVFGFGFFGFLPAMLIGLCGSFLLRNVSRTEAKPHCKT